MVLKSVSVAAALLCNQHGQVAVGLKCGGSHNDTKQRNYCNLWPSRPEPSRRTRMGHANCR
jgi:hypothetical protein